MNENRYAARILALASGAALAAQKASAEIIVIDLSPDLTTVPYTSNFMLNPVANQYSAGFETYDHSLRFDSSLGYGTWASPSASVNYYGATSGGDFFDNPVFFQLTAGAAIGPSLTFFNSNTAPISIPSGGPSEGATASSFLAYSVSNQGVSGNQTWYGWIEYSSIGGVRGDTYPPTSDFTVMRYAFDNTGAGLLAGQTAAAVPEPGVTAAAFGVVAIAAIGARRIRAARSRAV